MSYAEFIQNIIDTRGRFNCGDEYHERHHIIPKCMGGIDDDSNLIDLYAREHFIAHKLLAIENPDNQELIYAWNCMAFFKSGYQNRYELTPEEYEEVRICFSKIKSVQMKELLKDKSNHPMFGKTQSSDSKRKNSETHKKLWEDDTFREKCTIAHQTCWAEESRAKQSNSQKERLKAPENNPMYGKHHTEDTKRKISDMASKKRVFQFTKDDIFIREWESLTMAQNETGILISNISACALGKVKSAGGYIWKYIYNN